MTRHRLGRQHWRATPRTRVGRVVAVTTLLVAVLLLLGLLAAFDWTAYWVDEVPGGDAGLAASPELEAGRLALRLFGGGLLALGSGAAIVLLAMRRRRGRSTSAG